MSNRDSGASHFESRMDDPDYLRNLIREKPRNAKLMATLACVLANQETRHSFDSSIGGESPTATDKKAIYWAEKSIETAPQKPFGYSVLSKIHKDFGVRMDNLQKAIDRTDNQDSFLVARIDMLIQLLELPRKKEKQQRLQVGTGDSSNKLQVRRPLDASEEETYSKVCTALDQFWEQPHRGTTLLDESGFVATREYALGVFLRKLQPPEVARARARRHLQRVLEHLPRDHEKYVLAQFWMDSLNDTKDAQLDRCPKEYIRALYSTFAEKFDSLLVKKLHYQTPTLLRGLLDEELANSRVKFDQILDLGCGTGLSGLAFRQCGFRLEGVDLSPEMIDKARERGCYDSLLAGDVLEIFDQRSEWNGLTLVVACDVFCYVGHLEPIFKRVHREVKSGSIFAFSNELLHDYDSKSSFELHSCARYSHSREYIETLSVESGFSVLVVKPSVIRKNQGQDVQGLLTILRRE